MGSLVLAVMFDQCAHLCWRREEHQCSVTRHAAGQDDRLAGQRADVARIDLETEIGLPKLGAPTVGRCYPIGVLVVVDGYHLTARSDLLEVLKLRRQSCLRVSRATDIVRGGR